MRAGERKWGTQVGGDTYPQSDVIVEIERLDDGESFLEFLVRPAWPVQNHL